MLFYGENMQELDVQRCISYCGETSTKDGSNYEIISKCKLAEDIPEETKKAHKQCFFVVGRDSDSSIWQNIYLVVKATSTKDGSNYEIISKCKLAEDIPEETKKALKQCFFVVGRDGFEPSKTESTDLQSVAFGRSATFPKKWSW